MRTCEYYQNMIVLAAYYDELSKREFNELKTHLEACSKCQLEWQAVQQTVKLLNGKVQLQPTSQELEKSRQELHQRLLLLTQPRLKIDWGYHFKRLLTLDFSPALRLSTAAAMLIIGLLVGRFVFQAQPTGISDGAALSKSLAGENFIGVEAIHYNPVNRQVFMDVTMMQRASFSGAPENPEIQQLLAKTLLHEEQPNIRLKTVGALTDSRSFGKRLIEALVEVLEKDENTGIRLKTMKLLNSLPIDETVKNLLTQVYVNVLLNEKNGAIRIEAINGLSRIKDESVAPIFYNAAHNDTSEYVRYKAAHSLERIKNPEIPE